MLPSDYFNNFLQKKRLDLLRENFIVRNTEKKYCTRAIILSIFIGIFFLLLDRKDICKGVILGALFSSLNFILISKSILKRFKKTKNKTIFLVISNIIIRYSFMAVPLFIAIKLNQFHILGVIIGLFSIQLSILIDYMTSFPFS